MGVPKRKEYVNEIPIPSPKRRALVKKKKKINKNEKIKSSLKRKTVFLSFAAAGCLIVMLNREANISKMKYNMGTLDRKIVEKKEDEKELKVAVDEVKNSKELVEKAEKNINLRTAENSEIIKVKVKEVKPEEKGTFLKGIDFVVKKVKGIF